MKRKNITTACSAVQKAPSKGTVSPIRTRPSPTDIHQCDGIKPRCSRCQDRQLPCTYAIEGDGRRPASKSHVELLRSRIEFLENTLKAHSIDFDSSPSDPVQPKSGSVSRSNEVSGSLSKDESMNFEQDGEARYFGMASGRLEFQSASVPEQPQPESDLPPPQSTLSKQNIFNQPMISSELENELIDSYFKWEQPWMQAVDEKLFRDARATQGKYFSSLLLNCILALASRHSDHVEVRADPTDIRTAGRLFLERAEVLLHYEMKNPNITTLQSLCILAHIYVAIGADAACWLYLGMATRLALDMGLNIDSATVTPAGWLLPEEVEVRKRIYWSIYCMDKLAAMYTGRVCTMLDFQAQISLPDALVSSEEMSPADLRRSIIGNLSKELVGVCQIIEKILLALYMPKSNIKTEQTRSFLSGIVLELKNWYYDLPKELGLEHNGVLHNVPAVYTMHMVYHTAFILLMRPSLLKLQDAESRHISYQGATDICNVAQKYRTAFEDISIAANHKKVELGLLVLDELSVCWSPAKRIYQNLHRLYHPPTKSTSRKSLVPPMTQSAPASRRRRTILDTDASPPTNVLIKSADPNAPGPQSSSTDIGGPSPNPQSLDAFMDWPFNDLLANGPSLTDPTFFGALHDFSYMETNPIFQFDALPNDYSSFDILNRIQVHNL
ncbi:fungal-specific transcription factor domain-containing protein [Aspergillus karnatakaensis]|uniref:Zn(II)2Cys6 transcription factor n=1 Tax=Aspergillus karnatakaensis TaxID=1810916 RepID=UPI003CCDD4B5